MKKLTAKQVAGVVAALNADIAVQPIATKYGVTYHAVRYWKRYLGLDADWFRYVRDLEKKNRLLTNRHAVSDKLLKIASQVIKQFVRSSKRRALMAPLLQTTYDLRRASANRILGISHRAGESERVRVNNAPLVRVMKDYLAENPGQGFPTMFGVLLRHQPVTRPHALKLYREYAMQIQFRRQRKLPHRVLHPMEIQGKANRVWSMDFMMGALPNGERFFVLNGIDDYNREAMFTKAIRYSSTKAVLETLAHCLADGRKPEFLRTDNGGEFKSKWYIAWTDHQGIGRRYIRPGKSQENAFIESFYNTVRREVLNSFKFRSLDEVQRMLDDWRIRYNLGRPHQALGGLSPVQYSQAAALRQ